MFISRPGTNAGAAVRHIVPIALLFVVVVSSSLAAQDDKLADRATRAGEVLDELVAVPDSAPPNALLAQAVCVAVVPGVIQAGFGVGGRAGFGLVSCRTRPAGACRVTWASRVAASDCRSARSPPTSCSSSSTGTRPA